MNTYVPIRIHSPFSVAEGALRLDDLALFGAEHSIPAICVSDKESLAGSFYVKDAFKKQGIQPIHAVRMRISHPGVADETETSWITVVAQSNNGYLKVSEILSKGLLERKPIDISVLAQAAKAEPGFILLTGGLDGPIDKAIASGALQRARLRLKSLSAVFSNRLYVEVQRQDGSEDDAALIALANEMQIPCVATHTAWFLTPDMAHAHDTLLCIADGVTLNHQDRRKSDPSGYMLTPSQMFELFSDIPQAVENTVHMAKRCHWFAEEVDPLLPEFPTVAGRTEAEELRAQSVAGLEGRLSSLEFGEDGKTAHGYTRKDYTDRLDYELSVIEGMGFPGYFLIVADFIKWSKDNDIPVGPGRGSGAGSVVAWVLTITDLDPLRYGLYFERFLNPERVSMPDFDIDFCRERRMEVVDYVREKYGMDRVALIGTLGKLKANAVIRGVGRAMQIPYTVVERFCALIPSDPANPMGLAEAMSSDPLKSTLASAEDNIKEMFETGLQLEGLYANTSTHAAGVVIGRKPIAQIVPAYIDDHDSLVSAYDMKSVEKASLVKFDFLGLKTLDVIKSTIEIANRSGDEITLEQIGTEDDATYEMLRRGDAFGVFQLESAGMRKAMLQIQPTCIEDIVALVALYRPGPMDNIPLYASVKSGDTEAEYLHPIMQETLAETHGIIVYQEQVMKLAQDLAGYTLGGADVLRRAMGKKIQSEMDKQRGVFLAGTSERGIDQTKAESIFNLIAKFANYGFNKSHAAAYGVISFQTAYLRRHFPEAFLAGSMNLDISKVELIAPALENARRNGINTLPPCVNQSEAFFEVEVIGETKYVRHALAGLRGVGIGQAQSIVDERRKNGPFKSLPNLVDRMKGTVNKKILSSLVASGAADCLHLNRAAMTQIIPTLLTDASRKKADAVTGQRSLFDFAPEISVQAEVEIPDVPDWSNSLKYINQYKVVGFFLDGHPIEAMRSVLMRKKGSFRIADLYDRDVSLPRDVKIGCIVLDSEFKKTKAGKPMLILKISDETALAEAIAFGDTVQQIRDKVSKMNGKTFAMTVGVAQDSDDVTIFIRDVELLDVEH
jgi:DNA polymerase-3 subunit alpha